MKTNDYDHAYKLFFSEPLMVEHLLTCFFEKEWVCDLDFKTLRRLSTEYTTDTYRERESDIVWKVQWQGEWLYLLILIEFQSSVDPFMVLRMLSYISLMYQDIIKEDAQVRGLKKLPPILPLIIYSGDRKWSAPLNFSDYYPDNLPKTLKKFQPGLSCWLLDEGRCIIDEAIGQDNLVASLVGLEQCKESSEMVALMGRIEKRLRGSEFDSVRRAFIVFFERILKEKNIITESLENEWRGEWNMLSHNIDIMRAKDVARGVQQGMQQGMQQGEFTIIKRQLIKRFGSLTAEQERSLHHKTAHELLVISERLLDAKTIDDIFQ